MNRGIYLHNKNVTKAIRRHLRREKEFADSHRSPENGGPTRNVAQRRNDAIQSRKWNFRNAAAISFPIVGN